MGIEGSQTDPHWTYFLALDSDLAVLARFVHFDARNYGTFSLEIARVLLAAASEVDVVAKQLCVALRPGSKAAKHDAYRDLLTKELPDLISFEVLVPRYGLRLKPWDPWKRPKAQPPLWWTANNKVKHQRHTNFHDVTLKNALNAVAGLFILLLYLHRFLPRRFVSSRLSCRL